MSEARLAVQAAEHVGVKVKRMSECAPARLFVVGACVLYRPQGNDVADAELIGEGVLSVLRRERTEDDSLPCESVVRVRG